MKQARRQVSPIASVAVILVVVLVAAFLFWRAAKTEKRVPGAGREAAQQEGRGPGHGTKGPQAGRMR
jgi:hypothetical protein